MGNAENMATDRSQQQSHSKNWGLRTNTRSQANRVNNLIRMIVDHRLGQTNLHIPEKCIISISNTVIQSMHSVATLTPNLTIVRRAGKNAGKECSNVVAIARRPIIVT